MASSEAKAAKAEARLAKKQLRAEKKFSKVEKSWIMYDWANSIYATNIMAAIFPIYFAAVATDTGNKIYGYAISIANLLVAILAPLLGAIGDFKGMKKKMFTGFLIIGLVFTVVMAVFGSWQMMLIGLIISRIGFSGSCLFYDSFLTDVTKPERMDRLSAWGYAMGYIGGSTIPFIFSIAIVFAATLDPVVAWYKSALPAVAASIPADIMSYKLSILLVVIWWSLFSIPFLKNVKQVHYVDEKPAKLAKEAFRNVGRTFMSICKDKRILCFILAYFFYIDGVDTIISLATNYGSSLGLDTIGMVLALLVTQIVAVPFSILYGNLGRKIGCIKMISLAVCIYFVITIVGFTMGFTLERKAIPFEGEINNVAISEMSFDNDKDAEAYAKLLADQDPDNSLDGRFAELAAKSMPVTGAAEADSAYKTARAADYAESVEALLAETECSDAVKDAVRQTVVPAYCEVLDNYAETDAYESALSFSNLLFWVLAAMVGTVQGGIQALSRSYFGQIIPPERSNEYYGFLDIFGKFSCVIGPALYALVYSLTGRASLGILSIILLFFAGVIALLCGRKHFKQPLNGSPDGGETAEAEETTVSVETAAENA